ncbi:MAG: sulfatase-like hydrolase/transferase [Lachnospiraceae bacterium]|nr:sulfatase-like hydrolase/transferase [Lachnospiraceae bacterium]
MITKIKSLLPNTLIFMGLCVWGELLLWLVDGISPFEPLILLRMFSSGAMLGTILEMVLVILPERISPYIIGLILFLMGTLSAANHCCYVFFGTYFNLSYMLQMGTTVAGDYLSNTLQTLIRNIWYFPLCYLPLILYLVFRRKFRREEEGSRILSWVVSLVLFLVCLVLSLGTCRLGKDGDFYGSDFSAANATPRYGMGTAVRLEIHYGIFGLPSSRALTPMSQLSSSAGSADGYSDGNGGANGETSGMSGTSSVSSDTSNGTDEGNSASTMGTGAGSGADSAGEQDGTGVNGDSGDASGSEDSRQEEVVIIYEPNVTDIDFASLDGRFPELDAYVASLEPTMQSAYTGMFAGKNLIFITAEAFSPVAVDKERTPALYKLSHEGFVCSNYYQPGWSQSTTGGEFANMTGLIPTWINGSPAFQVSGYVSMPLGMGWKFAEEGYSIYAFHNNNYTYYSRQITHPNLGYLNWMGYGNGLELQRPDYVPCSDLDLMQVTVPEYIRVYKETGVPFHTYYISMSGHANYIFGVNDMSDKNREAVEELPYSDPAKAYLAGQLELEYAMEYLLEQLEEAGILEDTVICISADHYPYALAQYFSQDYYRELSGIDDDEHYITRYRNTLILWCGSMEKAVIVETPCSSIDLVPTLYNLFGIEYDSRLFAGKDIFGCEVLPGEVSTAMPIVVFPSYGGDKSWITNAGSYEGYTREFTPFPGVTVGEDYVELVTQVAAGRWAYSKEAVQYDYFSHLFPEEQ